MNQTELERLQSPQLSHIARTLYVFHLHKLSKIDEHSLDLGYISRLLSSQSRFFPTVATLEVVKLCLTELEDLGFIKRRVPHAPWSSALIDFPLADKSLEQLPEPPFCMHKDWQPSASFKDAALVVGLEDPDFEDNELTEFVSFWLSRQEKRNQISWERTFALRLLRQRRAKAPKVQTKASSQAPMAESGSFAK